MNSTDLAAMPDEKDFELVHGELEERRSGYLSSWVGGKLFRLIAEYVERQGLGWVAPADAGFQCFPDPAKNVRRPDVSFIRKGRLLGERLPEGYVTIAPDLVVEVISPNDLAYEVEAKVEDYRQAGIRLIWIVNPQTRTVRVHRLDDSVEIRREGEELSGEDVIPGFVCPVDAIFPPPANVPVA